MSGRRRAALTCGIAAAAVAAAAPAVFAFPDGAPWEAAGGEGCVECHFDAPPEEPSAALSIHGLPPAASPGGRYSLTIRLADEDLVNAGFLLSAWLGPDGLGSLEAGRFEANDEKVATSGARARSSEEGSRPATPGVAEWTVVWRAPESLDAPIVFELWGNAGNDDKSPFGDRTHRRLFEVGAETARPRADYGERSLRTTE